LRAEQQKLKYKKDKRKLKGRMYQMQQ
jgi:hypothetical protein